MKPKLSKLIKHLILLAPVAIILSGCPSFSLVSPSFTYTNNYGGENPNDISCTKGTWYSSPYCSIPISKFISISSNYTIPYESNYLFNYAINNKTFAFNDIKYQKNIDKLNQFFLAHYPDPQKMTTLPPKLKDLYVIMHDEYIPTNNYQKLFEAYTYIYTISALNFATKPCNSQFIEYMIAQKNPKYLHQFVLYKAFSLQYTNNILMNLQSSVDGKYTDQYTLYNKIYSKLLEMNPYRLNDMAVQIYNNTAKNESDSVESDIFVKDEKFGEIGTFTCNENGNIWKRFGFEYFGNNVSGVKYLVNFKNPDDFGDYDKTKIAIQP